MILALDLGTKMGWAKWGKGLTSGVLRMDKCKSHGMKFVMLQCWLSEIDKPALIAYEDVKRHAGVLAAHAYGGYLGVVQKFAYENKIELLPLGVGQIKKHATSKGNATKQEMIAAAIEKWGVCPIDDNEADALAILKLAMEVKNVKRG